MHQDAYRSVCGTSREPGIIRLETRARAMTAVGIDECLFARDVQPGSAVACCDGTVFQLLTYAAAAAAAFLETAWAAGRCETCMKPNRPGLSCI